MSKKEAAFALFDAGKTKTSADVKALGLTSHTRANYFYEWKKGREGGAPAAHGGEILGGINETKQKKAATPPKTERTQETTVEEAEEGEVEEREEAIPEKPKAQDDGIGTVSEVVAVKGKDGKPDGPERKMATTIADDGIKCTVLLSLQTLALFRIAATTQAQFDGGESCLWATSSIPVLRTFSG